MPTNQPLGRALDALRGALALPGARQVDVLHALQEAGWHLVSNAMVTREDDPPIPDEHLADAIKYSTAPRMPVRRTEIRAYLDAEEIRICGQLSRETIAYSSGDVLAWNDERLGRHFLDALGSRLGVPGAADRFERERR